MIKVNLLNSVTERQGGAITGLDQRVSSPGSRLLLMTLVVGFLLAAVIGWDVIGTRLAKADAEQQLEEQKRKAAELAIVLKEQEELKAKIQNIDLRINAIKKLRAEQAGPSAVLDAMRERVAKVPGLYLESIEFAGGQLIVKGSSPREEQITQFGRDLEFSEGLFSNLHIETERKEVDNNQAVIKTGSTEAPKVNVVNFTIKCAYTPGAAGAQAPMTASAGSPAAPVQNSAALQVAKN